MADVFISYARGDRERIESLAGVLKRIGYSVWWDHEIAGGAAFAAEIERQLNQARVVVVAWSRSAVQSEWVVDEANAAKMAGKLVPIVLDATPPPLGFRQFQAIDFSRWIPGSDSEAVALLERGIARYVRRPGMKSETEGDADYSMPSPANAVAVLPLENFSGDPDQQYFVDGMHEAIIAALSQVSALKVISRTSVRAYAGTNASLREIGAELGVSKIIEGSVIRAGDEVRITVQLIDVKTDTHLWADSFDRDVTNILSLQREVARSIVDKVSVVLTPTEAARLAGGQSVQPEAYEAYLRGMYRWYKLTPDDLQLAFRSFDAALACDPDYAPAHAGIAAAWAGLQQMGHAPTAVAGPKIKSAVEKALALDPNLAQAHFTLGTYYTWAAWDWVRAEPAFRRAIELNPNFPDSHAYYAHYLNIVGRKTESEAEIGYAMDLDPFNPLIRGLHVACLMFWDRWPEALEHTKSVLAIAPDHWLAYQVERYIYNKLNMPDEAVAATRSLYETLGNPEVVEALEEGYEQGGPLSAFARSAETLAAQAETRFVLPTQIASLYDMAENTSAAVQWLEKAFEMKDPELPYLKHLHRHSEQVMQHPRTLRIIAGMDYPSAASAGA